MNGLTTPMRSAQQYSASRAPGPRPAEMRNATIPAHPLWHVFGTATCISPPMVAHGRIPG